MSLTTGDNAFAIRTGGGWILLPSCGSTGLAPGANAFVVRAGSGQILASALPASTGTNAVAVRIGGGEQVLWPVGCGDGGDGGGGCTGPHEYCTDCPCDAPLQQSYQITLAGFPSICGAEYFNGTWTAVWDRDCVWAVDIDVVRRVELQLSPVWSVAWADQSPGAPSGTFSASGGNACQPETATWSPATCYQPMGCWWLWDGYFADASCVVAA
jgi:hypothetical protein